MAYDTPGFSFGDLLNVTAVQQRFLVGKDTFQARDSGAMPHDGVIDAIEVFLDGIAGAPANVLVSLWRDSAGDQHLLPEVTLALGACITTPTSGYARIDFPVPVTVHKFSLRSRPDLDGGTPAFCGLRLSAGGTATRAFVYVSWRKA